MSDTTYTDFVGPPVNAAWLNDVNNAVYHGVFPGGPSVVAVASGGTGASTAAGARTNLGITPANIGAAASGANSDITSLAGLTTPLTVGQGGTGSATKNFVDLTTPQTVAGVKTFSNTPIWSAGSGATVSGVAVATTSGTAIDFTGIPSWAKRITVILNGVSTSGASPVQVQLGAGSIDTTGYASGATTVSSVSSTSYTSSTTGLVTSFAGATNVRTGVMTITALGSNVWIASHSIADTVNSLSSQGGGTKTLSGTLDRIRLTTVNGTDTFDAGSVNIIYE